MGKGGKKKGKQIAGNTPYKSVVVAREEEWRDK